MKVKGNQRGLEQNKCRNEVELEARTKIVSGLESDKVRRRDMAVKDEEISL